MFSTTVSRKVLVRRSSPSVFVTCSVWARSLACEAKRSASALARRLACICASDRNNRPSSSRRLLTIASEKLPRATRSAMAVAARIGRLIEWANANDSATPTTAVAIARTIILKREAATAASDIERNSKPRAAPSSTTSSRAAAARSAFLATVTASGTSVSPPGAGLKIFRPVSCQSRIKNCAVSSASTTRWSFTRSRTIFRSSSTSRTNASSRCSSSSGTRSKNAMARPMVTRALSKFASAARARFTATSGSSYSRITASPVLDIVCMP